jgi:hypothetical protein
MQFLLNLVPLTLDLVVLDLCLHEFALGLFEFSCQVIYSLLGVPELHLDLVELGAQGTLMCAHAVELCLIS